MLIRRLVSGLAVTLVAAACQASAAPSPAGDPEESLVGDLVAVPLPEPSSFTEVTAGPVHALILDRWKPSALTGIDSLQEGVMASPRPEAWRRLDGSVEGMAAVWLDVARGGIPSDYYYLAAAGRVLSGLTTSEECRHSYHRVILDHRPAFAGIPGSPGDYVARGSGTCDTGLRQTRWSYFVAAPGYGPVREMGIPNSGLYVVVAVLHDSPDAAQQLRRLLLSARFGDDSVREIIRAATALSPQL